ncbi:MAG: hypothetical protein R2751_14760 [Bacteroidales bacterium]
MVAAVLVLAFLVSLALAPAWKMKELRLLASGDPAVGELAGHPANPGHEMDSLLRERAYKRALLQVAESDSIQLVIHLSDSTVLLQMKGVILHSTKIRTLESDRFLDRLPLEVETVLLSHPLPLKHQTATIVKEPVVERQAPKDTAEAALTAWAPDTLIQNPAFVALDTECGIRVVLEQEVNPRVFGPVEPNVLPRRHGPSPDRTLTAGLFHRKKLDYIPTVQMTLPVEDLRSIYRALPDQALVVLKL